MTTLTTNPHPPATPAARRRAPYTVRTMTEQMHLDVRTITLGVNLLSCSSPDPGVMCRRVRKRLRTCAGRLAAVCGEVARETGVPVVNRRIAITPAALVAAGHTEAGMTALARTLDETAAELGVDLVGGYTALVEKGWGRDGRRLVDTLPEVLATTERLCASVSLASTRLGLHLDAARVLGHVLRETARRTADHDGFGCAKLVALANAVPDNPFMAGAFHGVGEPDEVVNVGVSGPGVVRAAVADALAGAGGAHPVDVMTVASAIKSAAAQLTEVGDRVGRAVAARLGAAFGVVDLSLAPTPVEGDSVGEILQAMGVERLGGPGSTAALALLNDAVKKGGSFAGSSVGGLSGAFLAVAEDVALARAAEAGDLTLPKLEAMTAVCSVGLDMIALPGDTDPDTLAALIADEMAIGVINNKTTAARLIPVPGKVAGDRAVFGGLFGETVILPVPAGGGSHRFVRLGGRIPAPLHSLKN